MRSEVYNIDCMEYMKTLPDKYFGLTIADPPYGVSYARGKNGWGVCDNRPDLEDVKWDKEIPRKEFFDELLRVSDRGIIWGGAILYALASSVKMLACMGQMQWHYQQKRVCRCRTCLD